MDAPDQHIDLNAPEDFAAARDKLDLSREELARILSVSTKALERWEKGRTPIHPVAARQLQMLIDGYRPSTWPRRWGGADLRQAREEMGMTPEALADLLDVETRVYDLWENGDGPPELVAEALSWIRSGALRT